MAQVDVLRTPLLLMPQTLSLGLYEDKGGVQRSGYSPWAAPIPYLLEIH